MANYDYKCPQCGPVSVSMKMSDFKRVIQCPICDSPAQVSVGSAQFILKGSGFYSTDTPQGRQKRTRDAEERVDGSAASF